MSGMGILSSTVDSFWRNMLIGFGLSLAVPFTSHVSAYNVWATLRLYFAAPKTLHMPGNGADDFNSRAHSRRQLLKRRCSLGQHS